jgi:predicted amidohydrolase YtcJ
MRDLNRLGVTSVIDAGGGFQNYPDDYAVVEKLHDEGQLTVRIAYNLFTQKPKAEKEDFLGWTAGNTYQQGDDYFRLNGGGEMLVFSAADFEDFRSSGPTCRPRWRASWRASCASWRRTAGPGGCMPPTTRRSAARSTCSNA